MSDALATLERLITFLPYNLVEEVVVDGGRLQPRAQTVHGCLLTVGLSAVPPRAGRRTPHPAEEELSRAAETLSHALARVLEDAVFPRGGYLLKFSDAGILCMFTERCPGAGMLPWSSVLDPQRVVQRAARAGLELVAALKEALPGTFNPRAGLEYGRFRLLLVGGGAHLEQLCVGSLCHRCAQLRDRAHPGEVVVGPRVLEVLQGQRLDVGPVRGDGRRLLNLPADTAGQTARVADLHTLLERDPAATLALLTPLTPPLLRAEDGAGGLRTASGEIRPLAVCALPLDVTYPDEQDDAEVLLDASAGMNALLQAVGEAGGQLIRVDAHGMGSAAVVAFGLTDTLRQASRAAVGCALTLSRRLSRDRPRWRLSAGIEAGRVYLGEVGSPLKRELAVVGGASVVALTLARRAEHAQVLVGDTAWRLAAPRVVGRPVGPVDVGFPPVSWPAHEARSLHQEGTFHDPPAARELSLDDLPGESGRERVQRRVLKLVKRAQEHGPGGAVLLLGPRGSGKSGLCRALWDEAVRQGFRGAHIRCGRDAPVPGASARVRLWRDLVGLDAGAPADAAVAALQAELGPVAQPRGVIPRAAFPSAGLPAPALDGPAWPRLSATAVLIRHLQARSAATPVMVVVEDLHLADEATVHLVADLMHLCAVAPVVVLASANHDADQDGASLTTRATARLQAAGAAFLTLPPLSATESQQLLAHHLGLRSLLDLGQDAALAPLLLDRAGGHPRKLMDLADLVRVRVAQGRGWARAFTEAADPHTPDELAQLRLDGLPASRRRLCRVVALMGDEVPAALIWRSQSADPEHGTLPQMMDGLRELVEDGVLEPALVDDEVGYRFRSSMLRKVAALSWPGQVRAQWHDRVAVACGQNPAPRSTRALSRQLTHLRAGSSPGAAGAVVDELAARLVSMGELAAALEVWTSGGLLERDASRAAERGLAMAVTRLRLGQAVAAERQAVAVLDDLIAAPGLRVTAAAVAAAACLCRLDAAAADRVAARALPVLEAAGERVAAEAAAVLHAVRGVALTEQGDPAGALALLGEALGQGAPLPQVARALALWASGQVAVAAPALERLARQAAGTADWALCGAAAAALGQGLCLMAPLRAEQWLSTAADVFSAAHWPHQRDLALLWRARALTRDGRAHLARTQLTDLGWSEHLTQSPHGAGLAAAEAAAWADQDPGRASVAWRKAQDGRPQVHGRAQVHLCLDLAVCAQALGDGAQALRLRDEARALALTLRAQDLVQVLDGDATLPG